MPRRDNNLAPIFAERHKLTPASLEQSLKAHMKVLGYSDAHTIKEFLPDGTLTQLAKYAGTTTAVLGFLFCKVLKDLDETSDDRMKLRMTDDSTFDSLNETCCTEDYTLTVSFVVSNQKGLQKVFDSSKSVVVSRSSGVTDKCYTQVTGHGTEFDLLTQWVFRPTRAMSTGMVHKFSWQEHVVVAPKESKITPIVITPPPATEYDIGALLSLMHTGNVDISAKGLGIPESGKSFPRHNPRVQQIEAALGEVTRLIDSHIGFLSSFFPTAVTRNTSFVMPWSLAASQPNDSAPKCEDTEIVFWTELAVALHNHHAKEFDNRLKGQCPTVDMLQLLVILRTYARHIVECYKGIDHVMVRSFLQSIGSHNASLFHQGKSLDGLLTRVGKHQMERAGITNCPIALSTPGVSIRLELQSPTSPGYFQPLEGIPRVTPDHKGALCFQGGGRGSIKTVGTSTRYVFVVPTESTLLPENNPVIRVQAVAAYDNLPVMVVLGVPSGVPSEDDETIVSTAFLFMDMAHFQQTMKVSFIPSNKAFKAAVAVLPSELADFASAIREMDVSNAGFCVEIVELRGAIADAIGVSEDDLAGDSAWLRQLIHIMRGGASLQSLSPQATHKSCAARDDFVEVSNEAGPSADAVKKIKERSQALYDRMIAQGCIDHKDTPPPLATAPQYSNFTSLQECSVYRSCGADDGDAGNAGNAAQGDVEDVTEAFKTKIGTGAKKITFMQQMLNSLETIPEPEAALGAKIEMNDPATHCLFARGKCPDGVTTNDKQAPADSEYKADPDLNSSTDALYDLLSHSTKPPKTHRLTLFGVGCVWETNMITRLMSENGRDPSKVQLEIAQKVHIMQTS
jgi:hypothetical protein